MSTKDYVRSMQDSCRILLYVYTFAFQPRTHFVVLSISISTRRADRMDQKVLAIPLIFPADGA